MCYDNDCVLEADHEGCHTDGSGAWIDGGKPVVRRVKNVTKSIRFHTPSVTECIGYTIGVTEHVYDEVAFKLRHRQAVRDLKVERKLSNK